MVNPAVTPAFRRRLFAWLLASCTFSIFAYAQPAPVITGETAVCQGDAYFYATTYTVGHTWAWTVTSGGTILPVRVEYSRCWRLKSWDGFMIPKPFATVHITFDTLHQIAPTADEWAFEEERARLEMRLRAGAG